MAIRTLLPDAALDAFLASFAPLGTRVASRGIEAGTVNTSYALDLTSGHYFLRLYEEQDFGGAAREAEMLAHLAEADVPTPAPIAGADGAFVRLLAGKPASLFPWRPGQMVCQKGVTPTHGRLLGAALAQVHLAGGPCGEGRFHPDALVARCDRIGDRALAASLATDVATVASRRNASLPTGLLHGDLFRDNVLWNEGTISALLDFESAHRGPYIYDVAVAILSWSFSSELELPIARSIAAGYQEVRPLLPAEREAFLDEAVLATLRFAITRITDDAIRVGKKWQRFVQRREALEALGRDRLVTVLAP